MTAHIQKFVDRLRVSEQRHQRDVILSMSEAKDLHADITKLLAVVHDLLEQRMTVQTPDPATTEITGGTF